MSNSVIAELQKQASENDSDVVALLRKSLIVATKLELSDFRKWIESELEGYPADREVPDYRKLRAELRAYNPYHGLIPFELSPSTMDAICNVSYRQPIHTVTESLEHAREHNSSYLLLQLSSQQKQALYEVQSDQFARLEPVRTISPSQIAGILSAVRTMILQWALKLEQSGILGTGISFSQEEKKQAQKSPSIQIQQFQGVLGDVVNSDFSQDLSMGVKPGDFSSLSSALKSHGITESDIEELGKAISADESPAAAGDFGPNVRKWFSDMVGKVGKDAWNMSLSAANQLLINALNHYYGLG